MLVGLVGVLLPVLPGLLLIGFAGLAWAWLDGGGLARWTVFAAMSLVLLAGTVAKYALPARSARTSGAPRSHGAARRAGGGRRLLRHPGRRAGHRRGGCGLPGRAEPARRRGPAPGARPGRSSSGVGLGVLIELAAGLLAILVWVAGAVAI